MPSKPPIRPARPRSTAAHGKRPGGGTAAGGGINFQAAVTAIAGAHLLRGTEIGWLPVPDVPVAVWAESEGAGDDVRLELATDLRVEVQAKKGLQRGGPLWKSLEAMAEAIGVGDLDYSVLAVAPDSSQPVREDLPKDLLRLAQGRTDHLTSIGDELHRRLSNIDGDWKAACRRIAVRVVHALEADGADIRATKEVLRSVCADDGDADRAWNALYRDAVLRIESRGRWTVPHLLDVLARAGIAVRTSQSPASLVRRLADWSARNNRAFALPMVRRQLPLDALINIRTVGTPVEQLSAKDAAAALARYHGGGGQLERDARIFDAEWTGRFRPHAVVVAGPGLGKSTLTTLLAERYAASGIPVLSVTLKTVAAAMQTGTGFSQALLEQGLSGSGVTAEEFHRASAGGFVVLADGLDDCGLGHDTVAKGIAAFATGHEAARIVVTTRPIGYTTVALADWQHYRLLAPDKDHGAVNIGRLLVALGDGSDTSSEDNFGRARRELARSRAADTISTSPLLLGMAAAVIHAKGRLPDTRPRLYDELFSMFETGGTRATRRLVAAAVARQVLDGLGWLLMKDALTPANDLEERLRTMLAPALGKPPLAVAETIEAALAYWEELGLIERLHHGGTAYWTFLHKSFTEFAASRLLMALPTAERARELDRLVDDPAWHEVVAFAGGLGLSDEIARLFVDRRAAGHPGQMERALALAADPDAAVKPGQVRRLAEIAFAMVAEGGDDRFEIGYALADLAKAAPGTIAEIAARHRDDELAAVRLVAWACLAEAAPDKLDGEELAQRLAGFLPTISYSMRHSLLGRLRLDGDKDRDLVERIALAALERQPDERLASFAEVQLADQALGSWSFRSRMEALLMARGVGVAARLPWERQTGRSLLAMMQPDERWKAASKKAFRALAEAATVPGEKTISDARIERLPQFGALYALSNLGHVPAYDVHKWARPFDAAALRAIVRAVAQASAIDTLALAAEAAEVLRRIDEEGRIGFVDLDLPAVDVPPPDWSRASASFADRAPLLAAMNHGSEWLAYLAGNILAVAPTSQGQSREVLDVAGSSLWAATAIVRLQQPADVANALILDRLASDLPTGAEHLFRGLREGEVDHVPAVDTAIAAGLASPHERVAEAAAELAEALDRRGQPASTNVLEEGYDRWTAAEGGTRGGVIPPSPRAALLKALAGRGALGERRLLAALNDVRSDVSTAAFEFLSEALRTSEAARGSFIGAVARRTLQPRIVAAALAAEPSFDAAQVAVLEELLDDADARWRRAGVEVLRLAQLPLDRRARHLAQLANDSEEEIRAAAAELAVAR